MTPDFTAAIETYFRDGMQAKYGADLPLYYSNVPVPDHVETFAVIHVLASDNVLPIHLGETARSRNNGIVQIDVYTPKDEGAGDGKRIAHFAAKLFKRVGFNVTSEGFVRFRDPAIQDRGEVRGRHKEMVTISYRYDFNDLAAV
jgi:hypothetical protein